jgi:hypothetical protein
LQFANLYTPRVYPVLDRLSERCKFIAQSDWDPRVKEQVTYDLLLVAAGDLEAIYQTPTWTLNTLLALLEKCGGRQEEHPFHRGLVMHRHLSLREKVQLGKLAHERIKPYLNPDTLLTLQTKAKMSLGNAFAGTRNLGVLIAIHPALIQLRVPFGELREEFEGFVNEILTDLLTYRRVNDQFSALTLDNKTRSQPSITFDFKKCLNLLNMLTDRSLFKIAQGDLLTRQAEAVKLKVDLIKQLRVILFDPVEQKPSRVSRALGNRTKLRDNLNRMVTPLNNLRPLYTWGTALDEAVNDLFDQIRGLALDMKKALDAPPVNTDSAKPWNIAGILDELKVLQGSTKGVMKEVMVSLVPKKVLKMAEGIKKIMPERQTEIEQILESLQTHFKNIQAHTTALIHALGPSSLYGEKIQALIAPLRPHLTEINLLALQQMMAIYRHQFAPELQNLKALEWNLKSLWQVSHRDTKSELLLNMAVTLFHLRQFVDSVLPLVDTRLMIRLRQNLNAIPEDRAHFDAILTEIRGLQTVLHEKAKKKLEALMPILEGEKDVIDASVITKALFGESSFKGKMVEVAAKTVVTLELDLSLNPTQRNIDGCPDEWTAKNLKQIFKEEVDGLMKILDRFNAIDFQAVLLTSDVPVVPMTATV